MILVGSGAVPVISNGAPCCRRPVTSNYKGFPTFVKQNSHSPAQVQTFHPSTIESSRGDIYKFDFPDGHMKLLHLWPPKFPQAE